MRTHEGPFKASDLTRAAPKYGWDIRFREGRWAWQRPHSQSGTYVTEGHNQPQLVLQGVVGMEEGLPMGPRCPAACQVFHVLGPATDVEGFLWGHWGGGAGAEGLGQPWTGGVAAGRQPAPTLEWKEGGQGCILA